MEMTKELREEAKERLSVLDREIDFLEDQSPDSFIPDIQEKQDLKWREWAILFTMLQNQAK